MLTKKCSSSFESAALASEGEEGNQEVQHFTPTKESKTIDEFGIDEFGAPNPGLTREYMGLLQRMLDAAQTNPLPILAVRSVQPDRIVQPPTPTVWRPEEHTFYEMAFLNEGECCMVLNDRAISMVEGDFCLIPKGETHYEAPLRSDCSYRLVWLVLKIPHARVFVSKYGGRSTELQVMEGPIVRLHNSMEVVLKSLARELHTGAAYSEPIQRGQLLTLLGVVAREIRATPLTSRRSQRNEFGDIEMKALRYMKMHYANADLTVAHIADHLAMNPDYFSVRFRRKTGYTPYRYLLLVRMQAARELLTTTDLPIGTVAERVGYTSAFHFSRMFKRFLGMSPRDFRQFMRVSTPLLN